MSFNALYPQTTVQVNSNSRPSEPTREFTYSEWQAMKSGMECYLLGYTGKQLDAVAAQWAKVHRPAFWIGYNVQANVMKRDGVAYAMYQRFGGEA